VAPFLSRARARDAQIVPNNDSDREIPTGRAAAEHPPRGYTLPQREATAYGPAGAETSCITPDRE
jgi:hypothetical protein